MPDESTCAPVGRVATPKVCAGFLPLLVLPTTRARGLEGPLVYPRPLPAACHAAALREGGAPVV